MKRLAIAAMAAAALPVGAGEAQVVRDNEAIEVRTLSGEFRHRECTGLYTGNVVATRGGSRLTSDRLTMIGSRDAAAGAEAECEADQLIAEGRVRYSAPDVTIGADKGEFDTARDTITFTGDVIMASADQGVMRGTELVYNVADKSSRITAGGEPVLMIIMPRRGG